MIKLLIVDDEKITRDGLRNCIPWNDLGIDVIETAKNGLIALEIAIQLNPPDIMLCDIKMPKMDGVELATKIRELYPECKIIFLSGYSEKEYLKSAIKLKAFNFIDKPVNYKEITTVTMDAILLCTEEKIKIAEDENIKNQLIENIPFIRQRITLEIINYETDIGLIKKNFGNPLTQFRLNGIFTVASIIFNWRYDIPTKDIKMHEQNILQLIYQSKLLNPSNYMAGFTENNNLAFILAKENCSDRDTLYEIFVNLQTLIYTNSHDMFTLSLGISESSDSFKNIPSLYLKAVAAANMQFYLGVNRIIYEKDITSSPIIFDENIISAFKYDLKKGCITEASNLIKKLTQEAMLSSNTDINQIITLYFNLLLTIFQVVDENIINTQAEEINKRFICQEFESIKTLTELSTYLLSYIEVNFLLTEEKEYISIRIKEITSYIEKHYCERNFSVHSIANHIHLCHTYVCTIFKKITGKTINEYITEMRVEKAKVLLKDTKIKLYEIATNLGFSDVNYFSTLFKKNTGQTPNEFRKRYYL